MRINSLPAIVLMLALIFGLCACEKKSARLPAQATPPATATPDASPEPTPAPQVQDDAFRAALANELPLLPAMQINNFDDLAEHMYIFRDFLSALPGAARRALKSAAPWQDESVKVNAPGWKFFAALYMRVGDDFKDIIAQCCDTSLNGANPSITIGGPQRLYSKLPNSAVFSVTLAYAYLNTIYDDNGEEIPYVHPELSESYLKNLHDPLPGRHIKDGWYNDRDKGTRKHTGTDIRAPENTDILSCTNGEVLYIDTNDSAGYYVVVRDTLGYEYHYYHMVRLTDFLKPGDYVMRSQVIGHVGNTGNSSANHLHLTIVSPEYTFINPYTVLKDMRELQK